MGQPGSQAGFRLFSKKAFLQQAASLGQDWAKFMLGDKTVTTAPQTIREAWYRGATHAYTNTFASYAISPMVFAVAGDSACRNDMLQTKTNTVLSGGAWFYDTRQ